MPTDALTMFVTSGLSVGVFAGIVSGIFYVIAHGITTRRYRNSLAPWQCGVCGTQFRSFDGVLELGRVVTCTRCRGRVCRTRCATRDIRKGWICQLCRQPESWFKGILNALQPNTAKAILRSTMDPNRIDELDEDLEELRKKEKEQVRDFIERLVEAMLGGSIDSTSVDRVYHDKQYDDMFAKYHADISETLTDLGSALHISIASKFLKEIFVHLLPPSVEEVSGVVACIINSSLNA